MIKVFSAPWCSGCVVLKNILKSKGIEFTEVNIDTEEGTKEAREFGVRSLPTTVIGDKIYIGSSESIIYDIMEVLSD